jgi:hypothetical protein
MPAATRDAKSLTRTRRRFSLKSSLRAETSCSRCDDSFAERLFTSPLRLVSSGRSISPAW